MKDIISFYKNKEIPTGKLQENTLAIARCEFHKREITIKALSALFAGFALSLIVCPQFGFGLPEGHGISHVFWMINPMICALFCGLFLFLCANISLVFVLNKYERQYFYQKTSNAFFALPAIMWMFFMVMPETSFVSVGYTVSWLLGAILMWHLGKGLNKRLVLTNP